MGTLRALQRRPVLRVLDKLGNCLQFTEGVPFFPLPLHRSNWQGNRIRWDRGALRLSGGGLDCNFPMSGRVMTDYGRCTKLAFAIYVSQFTFGSFRKWFPIRMKLLRIDLNNFGPILQIEMQLKCQPSYDSYLDFNSSNDFSE